MLPTAVVTARVRAKSTNIGNEFAAMVTFHFHTTAAEPQRFAEVADIELLPADIVTACARGALVSITDEFAAAVTFPCHTTATEVHGTLLFRSALGAPQR